MRSPFPAGLLEVAPELARLLQRSAIHTPPRFAVAAIHCETAMIPMRDGVRLATDLYLPPELPAPAVLLRTPYGRSIDAYVGLFVSLARRGYVVIAQDCRGTGDSEPDSWDYYMFEPNDSYDLVEWVTRQSWFDGFVGSCGGSYSGQMQWQMALHPRMSAIVPDVSGLGRAVNTAHLHMFNNAYARSVGKGEGKSSIPYTELEAQMLSETLESGYFNEPLHRPLPELLLNSFPNLRAVAPAKAKQFLWEHYCALECSERASFVKQALGVQSVTVVDVESLSELFGHRISHDRHTLPHSDLAELCSTLCAPALLRTGWYDWGLNDALATWELLVRAGTESVRSRSRLLIGPNAHNMPGYHEGMGERPELQHAYSVVTTLEVLLRWYDAVRNDRVEAWPTVTYYLMGANTWCAADSWPVAEAQPVSLYLASGGRLTTESPPMQSNPEFYTYDPTQPTPTIGGSIVSYVYPPGSADVSSVHQRKDVLTYTTEPLDEDLDVVGPLRMILYASSSAVDTDFAARLSDVFPDGRAIQLQNGLLRARYRNAEGEPELLEPGRVYRLEIDLWATANRFKRGHRLRVDISSADFPRFDRNTNRGGERGRPVAAHQTIYHDERYPSHLAMQVLGAGLKT